jgi:receptor protein-tyrosine kinase
MQRCSNHLGKNMTDTSSNTLASDHTLASGNTLAHRSIGAILIDAGRLSPDNADIILRLQRERGTSFGETALGLGLLTQADIELGLSRQFDFPYLLKGQSKISHELIAGYEPFGTDAEALRALRSQLMLRWFGLAKGRSALAITSAGRGEGRSFLAANLAMVFSQLGERTLLIDADMRNPRQHQLFGLDNRSGLSALLSGRSDVDAIEQISGLPDLSLLPSGAVPPNPQELLARPLFQQLLEQLAPRYDVILIDTPAFDVCADAQSIASRAGAALVVARNNVSHVRSLRNLADGLGQASVVVVGTVLNEF